jgi:ABC-type sugar transport system substrate-binding protein
MRSSSRCPVLLGCVLLTLFTLYALGAGAQPASDVILLLHVQLADGGWPEAEQRARAELEADGFTIVVVESPPTTGSTPSCRISYGLKERSLHSASPAPGTPRRVR